MFSHIKSVIFTLALCALMLQFPVASGASNRRSADLNQTARNAIRCLQFGNFKKFNSLVSKHGLVIVKRNWDPNLFKSGNAENNSTARDAAANPQADIDLSHSSRLVWTEQEADFASSDLKGSGFHRIFNRFGSLIKGTLFADAYRRGVEISLDLMDNWKSRRLGPAAGGKICAGSFWYIYFVKERGQWKVWRMEEANH
jgi:hypothetical protein